jgi:hypothetical protein
LVFNEDFSDGKSGVVGMAMIGNALEMANRTSLSHSPQQNIRVGYRKAGERFIALAPVRLEENADPTLDIGHVHILATLLPVLRGNAVCPRMRLRSFVGIGLLSSVSSAHNGYC